MSDYTSFSVYAITCVPIEQVYIGATRNVASRRRGHFSRLKNNKHGNDLLQAAYNSFGQSAFRFNVIESGISAEHIVEREQFWIKYHFSHLIGFNLSEGGEGMHIQGVKPAPSQTQIHKAAPNTFYNRAWYGYILSYDAFDDFEDLEDYYPIEDPEPVSGELKWCAYGRHWQRKDLFQHFEDEILPGLASINFCRICRGIQAEKLRIAKQALNKFK